MLSVVEHYNNSTEERSSIKRIISASLIVCYLQKVEINEIRHQSVADLFQLFDFQPDIRNRQCHELDILTKLFQQNSESK